ncbi:MAG: 2-phospho-L-lactate transferase [Actinomycetota bacterium]|nr:2-phospho-L-lactate transferase [Actinomycetota bacterium]
MRVTALAGGVGAAKLLVGLQEVLEPTQLTAVVNTGDDAVIYGVHVSPDLDICTYWLAGIADRDRGWGIRDDTFHFVEALGHLGRANWFRLGDKDLATCIYRTQRLKEGASLTVATAELARSFGLKGRILPMSDDPVRTMVVTDDGRELNFQEYFVKERTEPEIAEIRYEGTGDARPGPAVLDAVASADVLIVCPSNPHLSIEPILSVSGVRPALVEHPSVVSVSPIVGGAALKGPADRLLKRLTGESSAAAVADRYRDFCTLFVCDSNDRDQTGIIEEKSQVETVALDTIMSDLVSSRRLAESLLEVAW